MVWWGKAALTDVVASKLDFSLMTVHKTSAKLGCSRVTGQQLELAMAGGQLRQLKQQPKLWKCGQVTL